jgi:hypothetical protein
VSLLESVEDHVESGEELVAEVVRLSDNRLGEHRGEVGEFF